MDKNYQQQKWFSTMKPDEKVLLKKLIALQKDQGDMLELQPLRNESEIVLSDTTPIAGKTWRELKLTAMDINY